MDSTIDISALRSAAKLKAQGEAIADGLAVYYKLQPKEVVQKPVTPKEETIEVVQSFLNSTGRKDARELIKKAVVAGIFQESHLAKVDSYTDVELISYSIAYVNRTAK